MKYLIALLLISGLVHAKEYSSTGIDFVHDSDASNQLAPYVGYTNKNPDKEYLVRVGVHSYKDKTYPTIIGGLNLNLTKELDTSFKLGMKSDIVGHAEITYTTDSIKASVSYERDVVDTEDGLKHDITNQTIGGYADLKLSDNLTLTAGVFNQQNSDHVDSLITVLKASYVISDNWKIELIQKNNDRDVPKGYTPPYFHPETDNRTTMRLHYALPLNEHNHLTLMGGLGKRKFEYETVNLYEYGVKLKSTITESTIMNLSYQCFKDTNNYQYCRGGINFDFYY